MRSIAVVKAEGSIIRPTPMPLVPGARLGPYEVTALIGSGGMGEVCRGIGPETQSFRRSVNSSPSRRCRVNGSKSPRYRSAADLVRPEDSSLALAGCMLRLETSGGVRRGFAEVTRSASQFPVVGQPRHIIGPRSVPQPKEGYVAGTGHAARPVRSHRADRRGGWGRSIGPPMPS